MVKKYSVFRDELDIKNGGVYSFTPFQKLDKDGNGVFKIGMSMNLAKRLDGYHLSFPSGLWVTNTLDNMKQRNRRTSTITDASYYKSIETFIYDELIRRGAIAIESTTRVRNNGKTEWIYTSPAILTQVFQEAHKLYQGNLSIFELTDTAMKKETRAAKKKKHYNAQIVVLLEK